MKIERIDHLNLTVADIDRSVEFYKRVLGICECSGAHTDSKPRASSA